MVAAALVESPTENYYFSVIKTACMSKRVIAEGVSLLIKSVATYLLLIQGHGLMAFAIS